jgi:hypothetical protein
MFPAGFGSPDGKKYLGLQEGYYPVCLVLKNKTGTVEKPSCGCVTDIFLLIILLY